MTQHTEDRARERPASAGGSPPTPPQPPRFGVSPRWIVLFGVLLAINLFISARAMGPESRVRVPYSRSSWSR
jgi:hypothetical protein